MAEAQSIEAPSREPPELEGQEVMPNVPQWLFDQSVPEAERGRYHQRYRRGPEDRV